MSDRNKKGVGQMDNSCGHWTEAGWIIPREGGDKYGRQKRTVLIFCSCVIKSLQTLW